MMDGGTPGRSRHVVSMGEWGGTVCGSWYTRSDEWWSNTFYTGVSATWCDDTTGSKVEYPSP